MVKQRIQKQKNKSDNEFWSAVKDIRKLTYESLSTKEKRIENKNKGHEKNGKMSIKILKGIRQKALTKHKEKLQEMKDNEVLYDSTTQKFDLGWYDKKLQNKEKKTKKHEYNSYKFKEANVKSSGRYSQGVLKFSKKDINRISYKKENTGFSKKGNNKFSKKK